jgi:ATP-binding cassette subfamily F protein 3
MSDIERSPHELSGGFQVRLHLAKLLLSEPQLLLLDEPTNYLDIVAMRWLESFLKAWPHELMLITHDQSFMDRVVTHILGIHRRKVRKVEGTTAKYYEQLALEEDVHERSRSNQEKKIQETEAFIRRFRAKASKASAVQSRVRALEKMEVLSELEEIEELDFRFSHHPLPGRRLLEVHEISFCYPTQEKLLIENVRFDVRPRDRIGVIGRNGAGKSTLLKLLAGVISPLDGEILSSPHLRLGYFGQTNIERLNPEMTVEEVLLEETPDFNRTRARSVAGLMMFEGDSALKKVKVLSGGEKSRVLLGKILLSPANLLLLDEPGNHLDMYSHNALLEAVNIFPGAVVVVTHSEMFLQQMAERLIVFDEGRARVFEGGYEEFLERGGWHDQLFSVKAQSSSSSGVSKKELRKLRAEIMERRNSVLAPLKKESSRLEREISRLEQVVEEDTKRLIEITQEGMGDEAAKLARSVAVAKRESDRCYDALAQVLESLEAKEKEFESELARVL